MYACHHCNSLLALLIWLACLQGLAGVIRWSVVLRCAHMRFSQACISSCTPDVAVCHTLKLIGAKMLVGRGWCWVVICVDVSGQHVAFVFI
jgi:hypothetical protein